MGKKQIYEDEEIIVALITEGTIKGAAANLNCRVRTIYDRMKKPQFKEKYAQAKSDLIKNATSKIQGHLYEAIDTLAKIMKDEDTAKQTRANCATSILQYAIKFTEACDIIERLEALEASQKLEGEIYK